MNGGFWGLLICVGVPGSLRTFACVLARHLGPMCRNNPRTNARHFSDPSARAAFSAIAASAEVDCVPAVDMDRTAVDKVTVIAESRKLKAERLRPQTPPRHPGRPIGRSPTLLGRRRSLCAPI